MIFFLIYRLSTVISNYYINHIKHTHWQRELAPTQNHAYSILRKSIVFFNLNNGAQCTFAQNSYDETFLINFAIESQHRINTEKIR